MQSKLLSGFLFMLFIALLFYYINDSLNSSRKKRKDFLLNGDYSIGVISSKSYSKPESVSFLYNVNNVEIKGGDTKFYLDKNAFEVFNDKEKSKPGKKFLVIYDANNPKKSIIRLDYPIKDSTDFKRYVKEFEQMRKQKAKE